MKQIVAAILNVMEEVNFIEKTAEIGEGKNKYKGLKDCVVKKTIGGAMRKNGLVIITQDIESKTEIDRWDSEENWGGRLIKRHKQQVFTEVKPRYLLIHKSGESIPITGYGHSVDSQDKGAGKATTYSLKNTLIYLFLVATDSLDDTDSIHSDEITAPPPEKILPFLDSKSEKWEGAISALANNRTTIKEIEKYYSLTEESRKELTREALILFHSINNAI